MAYFVYDAQSKCVACCNEENTAKRWALAFKGWYMLQRKDALA